MNVVYISQVYLNFTPGSQAHQVFVSGKTRDQSKRPALNQQTIRLENRGLSKNTIDLLIFLLQKYTSGSLFTLELWKLLCRFSLCLYDDYFLVNKSNIQQALIHFSILLILVLLVAADIFKSLVFYLFSTLTNFPTIFGTFYTILFLLYHIHQPKCLYFFEAPRRG